MLIPNHISAQKFSGTISITHKQNIPQNKIHACLLEIGYAKLVPKKQKKWKRCRYERDHGLSLLHADYMENEGIHMIAYEDDASKRSFQFVNSIMQPDNALECRKLRKKK